MHVVVVGAGRVGASAAGWLVAAGHEVAVIDEHEPTCSALDEALGSISIVGDGTDVGVLSSAGANRADILIATTRRDDVNLAACQLAKHKFGVSKTISVVNSPDYSDMFVTLGVDVAVDIAEMVLGRVQEGMAARRVVRLMQVSGRDGTVLVSIKIPVDSKVNTRPIGELALPRGSLISLVISNDGGVFVPGDEILVRPGDEVIAVTNIEYEEELLNLLIGGESE